MASVQSFVLSWTAMTAAMMAPSALPFVVSFARRARRWQLPAAALVAAYLLVWAVFGVAVYYFSMTISAGWPAGVVAAVAIAFVGLYAFTPVMRTGQARCIAMCRRCESVDAGPVKAAVVEGASYGLSCVACSGAVMLALAALGMSNVFLMLAGSALILLYKSAGRWPRRLDAGLSVALLLGGIWLII
jgi:predicted metal-binding membrane protein